MMRTVSTMPQVPRGVVVATRPDSGGLSCTNGPRVAWPRAFHLGKNWRRLTKARADGDGVSRHGRRTVLIVGRPCSSIAIRWADRTHARR